MICQKDRVAVKIQKFTPFDFCNVVNVRFSDLELAPYRIASVRQGIGGQISTRGDLVCLFDENFGLAD